MIQKLQTHNNANIQIIKKQANNNLINICSERKQLKIQQVLMNKNKQNNETITVDNNNDDTQNQDIINLIDAIKINDSERITKNIKIIEINYVNEIDITEQKYEKQYEIASYKERSSNKTIHNQQNVKEIQVIEIQTINLQAKKQHGKYNAQLVKQLNSSKSIIAKLQNKKVQSKVNTVVSEKKQSLLQKFKQLNYQKFQLFNQYTKNIGKILKTKIKDQQLDYPQISFSQYLKILTVWQNLDNETRNKKIREDKFIKYQHLQRLAPKQWLNDQIISCYINMLTDCLTAKNPMKLKEYIIFDSLKTISIFDKADSQLIVKILQKHKIQKNITKLILVINQNKHWFYIMIQPFRISKITGKIMPQFIIYDSLKQQKPSYYKKMKLINNILKFIQKYYNRTQIDIQICPNFPQQQNNSDCGVMMLCGIKDSIRNYLMWSFQFHDMNYKRAMITKQIIQGKLYGF